MWTLVQAREERRNCLDQVDELYKQEKSEETVLTRMTSAIGRACLRVWLCHMSSLVAVVAGLGAAAASTEHTQLQQYFK